jgi:hypothetical protein
MSRFKIQNALTSPLSLGGTASVAGKSSKMSMHASSPLGVQHGSSYEIAPGDLLATFRLISLKKFQYCPDYPVRASLRLRLDGSESVYDVQVFVSALDGTRELPSSWCCDRSVSTFASDLVTIGSGTKK